MRKLVLGSVVLLSLAACGSGGRVVVAGGTGTDREAVCHQQSRWATVGKVDGTEISITCADGYNAR